MDPDLGIDDPGWVPQLGGASTNGLAATRLVFLAFSAGLVLVGLVTLFLTSTGDPGEPVWDPVPAAAGVLLLGVVQYVVGGLIGPRLACGTAAEVAERWRARFFLRIAIAESGALLGFVASLQAVDALPYLAGLIPAAAGFARTAPTNANLRRDQEELTALGCSERLGPALVAMTGRVR